MNTQAHQAQEVQEVQTEQKEAEAREDEGPGQHEQGADINAGEQVTGSAVEQTRAALPAGQHMAEGRRLFASTGDNAADQVAAAFLMASSWPGNSLNDRHLSHQQVMNTQAHRAQAEAREEEGPEQHEQRAGKNAGEQVAGSAVEQTRAADRNVENGESNVSRSLPK